MSAKLEERIPAEQAQKFSAWTMPRIDAHGNILPSFEKEQRSRQASPNESVETVEKMPRKPQALTAELLERMREEASREGYKAGFQQGLQEGRQRGHDDAWSQAVDDIEQRQQHLQQLCARLLQPLHDEQVQLIALMQEQVEQIARAVIGRELQVDSSIILRLVEESIAALPNGAQHLRIYIHPQDSDLINTWLESNGMDARVIADERLQPGGCRIESEHSTVDYSVEARLQGLLAQSQQEIAVTDHVGGDIPQAEF